MKLQMKLSVHTIGNVEKALTEVGCDASVALDFLKRLSETTPEGNQNIVIGVIE